MRSRLIPAAAVSLLALIAFALGITAPAHASNGSCGPASGGLIKCTWTHVDDPGLFVVPPGVTSVNVTLIGAGGQTGVQGHSCDSFNTSQNGSIGGAGGLGAKVTGTLTVTPGEFLSITSGSTSSLLHGGAGGGGSVLQTGSCPDYAGAGGAGGGASFISVEVNGEANFLAVAAGGGGGGGGTDSVSNGVQPDGCGPGSKGGNARESGQGLITFHCTGDVVGDGGGGAGVTGDGNGAAGFSANSILTVGGGGGGGGGVGGGGGGYAGVLEGGAGGGGGSSLVPSGGSVTTSSQPASVVITYVDNTAPTTSIALSGTSQNGWYRGLKVNVAISASDNDDVIVGSDVERMNCSADPPGPQTFASMGQCVVPNFALATEGTHTVYAATRDFAGNVGPVASATFKLDQEWPESTISLSPSSPDGLNGWYVSPVGVSTSATDNLSGLAQTRCAADPASAPASYTALPSGSCAVSSVSADGQHTVYVASQDTAGNNEPVQSASFKVDRTGPSDAPLLSGSPGSNGWWTTDVSLAWFWSDANSGVDSNHCDTGGSTSGEGTNLTVSGSCKDLAGNAASDSKTFKVDKSAPTLAVAPVPASPNGSNGWYTSNVAAHFTCGDNLSGVASCPGDQTLSTEGSSVSSAAQTVNDNAGNTSASSGTITVKIDKTAPTVGVTGVTDGAQYTYGSVPAAGCSTSDAVSGVGTAATVSITGGTNGAGLFTATCSGAVDKAGNQPAPVAVTYAVVFAFGGYITPRPGGTVPYKPGTTTVVSFTLRDSQGQAISQAILSTLSGKLTAKLSGQGITPVAASCGWSQILMRFQCSLTIPALAHTGGSYPYQLTVYENLTGTPVAAPPFTSNPLDANPATVYFG